MPATHAATAWKGLPAIAPSRVAGARAGPAAGAALGVALGATLGVALGVAPAAGVSLTVELGVGWIGGGALSVGLSGSFAGPPQPDIRTMREGTRSRRRESMAPCGRVASARQGGCRYCRSAPRRVKARP